MISYRNEFFHDPGKEFVNISERLNMESTLYIVNISEATHSMTQLKQIELYFFYKLNSEEQKFLYTASLSQNTVEGPSIGIPNIHNSYLRQMISSEANCKATNSEPNFELSTVF